MSKLSVLFLALIGNNFVIDIWCFRLNFHLIYNLGIRYSVNCNEDAKKLLDDLFSVYNSVARPILDNEKKVELSIGLKLSQIADIVCIKIKYPFFLSTFKFTQLIEEVNIRTQYGNRKKNIYTQNEKFTKSFCSQLSIN